MSHDASRPLAIVIEPRPALANTVADALIRHGFETLIASTHAGGAALAAPHDRVDFLVAAVPAPGEDHQGSYLEEARAKNPRLAVVVMLSDPGESIDDAPPSAVKLVKPFDRHQLEQAIEEAMQSSPGS